jgi:hypothetical protein
MRNPDARSKETACKSNALSIYLCPSMYKSRRKNIFENTTADADWRFGRTHGFYPKSQRVTSRSKQLDWLFLLKRCWISNGLHGVTSQNIVLLSHCCEIVKLKKKGEMSRELERWIPYIEFLEGIPEEKRPFAKLAHKIEDNIKSDVKQEVCKNMDWL